MLRVAAAAAAALAASDLGSLRTALFNYLFAKAHDGAFVLRVEDTDRQRSLPGCVHEVCWARRGHGDDADLQYERLLDDYGLHRDEGPSEGGAFGPYRQSERTQLYRDAAELLIEQGDAYRCFCSAEVRRKCAPPSFARARSFQRLDIIRRQAAASRTNPRYDGRCRGLSAAESRARARAGEPHTIRFKFDRRHVSFVDVCHGRVDTTIEEGDFVLLKSDTFPTYHLANVVDDRAMRISRESAAHAVHDRSRKQSFCCAKVCLAFSMLSVLLFGGERAHFGLLQM